jgi:regulation of enolase protein 1 (concanavalin A-like superfamily)
MDWLNEPQQWTQDGDTLTVTVDGKTDFWRIPGTLRDNGHFIYQTVTGDFSATLKFSGDYAKLYDQAGIMLRLDDQTWLKTGVELLDGVQQASAVMTRGFSDWSILPLPDSPSTIWFRVVRTGAMVDVLYARDGADFALIRSGYLTDAPTIQVGMMCAAPEGDGFTVTFEKFTVETG